MPVNQGRALSGNYLQAPDLSGLHNGGFHDRDYHNLFVCRNTDNEKTFLEKAMSHFLNTLPQTKLQPLQMSHLKRRDVIVASALTALGVSSYAQTLTKIPGVSAEKVVLAHFGPLSGILAPANKEALSGAQYYFDQTNAKGGAELHLALKSGNFGTDDFFAKAFAMLA